MRYEEIKTEKAHPDLFITITLDESDIALLAYIKEMGSKLSTEDPVRVSTFYFKKQRILNKAILGNKNSPGIFGNVTSHFMRIEYQARGSPHAHILIVLKFIILVLYLLYIFFRLFFKG